jgi:hypothetical protein
MSKRTTSAICAVMIGCAALAVFAASGFGDDPAPAPTPLAHFKVVSPAMETASGSAQAAASRKPPKHGGGGTKRPKPPKVTNLITTNPVSVPAGQEVVAKLSCPAARGIPLSGGAISPPAPASVAISVISRFNPNPPFEAEPHNYYVGVRNTGVTAEEFRGTLVCGRGIKESGAGD